MPKFDLRSLLLLQTLGYPLLKAFSGVDVPAQVQKGEPYLRALQTLFRELAETAGNGADALRDGIVSQEEFEIGEQDVKDVAAAAEALAALVAGPKDVQPALKAPPGTDGLEPVEPPSDGVNR